MSTGDLTQSASTVTDSWGLIMSVRLVGILFLGFLSGMAVSSVIEKKGSKPPDRPANVPADAIWAGGPDIGEWVSCRQTSETGAFHCRVYANVTGVLVEEGVFRIRPESIDPWAYSNGLIRAEVELERGSRAPGRLH